MNWINDIINHRRKVHSQCGEEGFIEFIMSHIGWGETRYIVDIGASDGEWLSNTKIFEDERTPRLMFDGNNKGNQLVHQNWITAENIVEILTSHQCSKGFSLLSFDLDGNDLYVLDKIMEHFSPRLIVAEINGTIPEHISKTIVYNPQHIWGMDDYYGFSLAAGLKLAQKHNYRIIFQNDAMNAYFVRRDLLAQPDIAINLKFSARPYHPHNITKPWVEY